MGVDPFYVSLRWEEAADADAETDEDKEAWVWQAYVRRWLGRDLRWPPHLRDAAARPRPPYEAVAKAAAARRVVLRPMYKAAGLVGRAGVRVDVRYGAEGTDCGSGEVLGVGKIAIEALGDHDTFRKALGKSASAVQRAEVPSTSLITTPH